MIYPKKYEKRFFPVYAYVGTKCHGGVAMADSPGITGGPRIGLNQAGEELAYRSARELSLWLDTEAADGLMSQFQTLLQAAQALNQLAVDEADLLGLVGVLDQRAFPLLAILCKQVDKVPNPIAPSHRAMVADYAALLHELSTLYLRIVAEGLEQHLVQSDAAGTYLRKSVYLSHRLSLHLWRLYQAEPEGFWAQLHRALELGESLGVASEAPAPDEAVSGYAPASIETLVARIAVLASSDVYALRRDEATLLAGWLEAPPLRVSESVERSGGEHQPLLRLELDSDRPPSLLMGRGDAAPGLRFIDLDPLIAALRFTPPKVQEGEAGGTDDLGRRLQRRWVVPPMRQFTREPADMGPLVTVTGLQAIHRMIRADYRFPRSVTDVYSTILPGAYFAPESNDPEEIPAVFVVEGILETTAPEVTFTGAGEAEAREVQILSPRKLERLRAVWDSALRALDSSAADAVAGDEGVSSTAIPGWLRNVGAGGCCLRLQAPDAAVFGGNLIAIRLASEERILWQAGVIRWLRYDAPDTATVGVQYLAQACVPVDVFCLSAGEGVASGVQPGLFFRERGRSGTGSLLLDSGAFPAGVRVAFSIGSAKCNVMLESVRPESHVFSRADFTLLGNADAAAPTGRLSQG